MIEFEPAGQTISDQWPDIRNKKMKWGSTSVRMSFSYEVGLVRTSLGNPVNAFKFIPESLQMELFDRVSGLKIPKDKEFFDQFRFELAYNCHGYCFGESQVFIPDPSQFTIDDFEEVAEKDADVLVFQSHVGFGDNDDDIFEYSHAVILNADGTVSFKPGINHLRENVAKVEVIHTYNYNRDLYLRRR